MLRVQISFSATADLEKVKEQLKELAKENFEFYCCFLTREHVERKGFSTDIVDLLENTLGERLIFMTEQYETFEDVMQNIEKIRNHTAELVNRIYVLDSRVASGVADEVKMFTNGKVILMQ